MGVDVVTRVVIERPREIVAAFAANPDNAPAWYENIIAVEWASAPPLRVGARIAFVARFLGRRLAYTYEITVYELADRLVMRTAQGPFPMETSYEWRSLSETRTEMLLRNRGAPSGFGALVQPLMSIAMRRANRKDLARLKALLESRL
ncbi:MAG: SRPBCC family protein [Gemmatimonadaceae bacterium]